MLFLSDFLLSLTVSIQRAGVRYAVLTLLTFGLIACNTDTNNTQPVAEAGSDQASGVLVGDVVLLDGSGSTDADGDPLSYSWRLLTFPAGSTAELSNADTAESDFVPDQPGEYVARLSVNDGIVDSAADDVSITVQVAPPVVSITSPENLTVTGSSPVEVAGTVDDVAATLTVNGSVVANNNGNYTASVPLVVGVNTVAVVGKNDTGEDSASVKVIFSTAGAPVVYITSPGSDFRIGDEFEIGEPVSASLFTVRGVIKVNTLSLTAAANEPTVTVNNLPATVKQENFFGKCGLVFPFQCWTFSAGTTFDKGTQTITAEATDKNGRTGTISVDGTVDYCRKADYDQTPPTNFGVDPREPGVLALRGTNQSNRCHEVDGCSLPGAPKSFANNPMPGAKWNVAPVQFGAGTEPPSEFFIHGLNSTVYPAGCNIHDACYQTCVPKDQRADAWRACNRQQYKDHNNVCRRAYPWKASCPFTGFEIFKCPKWRAEWLIERNLCFKTAAVYFAGVSSGFGFIKDPLVEFTGWGVYVLRQEQYCAS